MPAASMELSIGSFLITITKIEVFFGLGQQHATLDP